MRTNEKRFSIFNSAVLLSFLVIYPTLIAFLSLKNYKNTEDKEVQQTIGSIFEGLNVKSKWAAVYNTFFTLRRLIIASICFFFVDQPVIQVQLFVIVNTF